MLESSNLERAVSYFFVYGVERKVSPRAEEGVHRSLSIVSGKLASHPLLDAHISLPQSSKKRRWRVAKIVGHATTDEHHALNE